MTNRLQKSQCKNGYLHDYRQIREYPKGILERCTRCKKQIFWPHTTPNHEYLAAHLRSALQPDDVLFAHEYPSFNYKNLT